MRFFGRKKKSFSELVDEYYETHKTWNAQSVERQFEILKQLAKMAKTDKEKILVNSLVVESKRRMSSTRNL
jgi:predicted CopG family antitoxin